MWSRRRGCGCIPDILATITASSATTFIQVLSVVLVIQPLIVSAAAPAAASTPAATAAGRGQVVIIVTAAAAGALMMMQPLQALLGQVAEEDNLLHVQIGLQTLQLQGRVIMVLPGVKGTGGRLLYHRMR